VTGEVRTFDRLAIGGARGPHGLTPAVGVRGGLGCAIGAVLGRAVRWQTIRPDEYGDMLRPHLGDHAADGVAAVYRNLAATPSAPAPDPAPAREALDWAPRDAAAWARQVPAFRRMVVAGPCR
jgi:hypothetical protein